MLSIPRHDNSLLGRWWWTVDRRLLVIILALLAAGCMVVTSVSPVQNRSAAVPYHDMVQHLILAVVATGMMLCVSLCSPLWIRRLACMGLAGAMVLMMVTTVMGEQHQGGQRWIRILGFSLQPSEFVKPTLAIVTAWMFVEWKRSLGMAGLLAGSALYLLTVPMLLLQKDLGQTLVISVMWWGQFFLAGMPMLFIPVILGSGGLLLFLYVQFNEHARERLSDFGEPEQYGQIWYAQKSFAEGGWLGVGPGEGTMKYHLPDAQSDFVFAALAEEFGLIGCFLIIAAFLFIFYRSIRHLLKREDLFPLLACSGLLLQLVAQAFINMASASHMIPAKGMTLPFISVGGTSILATGFAMGALLALTRQSHALDGRKTGRSA